MTIYKSIAEYSTLSAEQFFEQIAPSQKPIVIRGFAKNWPLVVAAEQAPSDFSAYLNKFYNGNKTAMVVAPPSANKRFYYNEDMTDINFLRGEERLDLFLGRLVELIDRNVYPAISMQSTLTEELLPGLVL